MKMIRDNADRILFVAGVCVLIVGALMTFSTGAALILTGAALITLGLMEVFP